VREQLTFRQWMEVVDSALLKVRGVDSSWLPDQDYRGLYDHASPEEAARYVLEQLKEEDA
jgi:hypothetical protein